MYFGQGEDFKLTTELSEKVQYPHNQAIKNGLTEAILLILCLSSNQDLILERYRFRPMASSPQRIRPHYKISISSSPQNFVFVLT